MDTNSKVKTESPNYGFPSHELPPQKKNRKWHFQYIKAFHKEFTTGTAHTLRWAVDTYDENRLYGKGKQAIDQYKDLLGVKKRAGKKDMSWRNLDWNILPIFPRFKRVIKNRLKKLPREIMLSAIDPVSLDERNQRYSEIMEYIVNQKFYSKIAGKISDFRVNSPFEPGEPIPENSHEANLYMDMYPKNRYILHMKDQIELAFLMSDWKEIEDKLFDDLIEVGIGATRTFIDNLGRLRVRRMTPEQMITNQCVERDFSDLIRVGEYVQMTISELRASVPAGTFTDADYQKMAQQASGKNYSSIGSQAYFAVNNCFPWDHERVTVLHAEWFSADDVAYVTGQNKDGNPTISKRDNPDWLESKGITDDEYEMFYRKKGEQRTILRDTINNVYKASWIVDTDFVYDYGRQNNMIRSIGSINDCQLSTTMYTLDFDSYVRQCIPILDNIQVNWLNYQHQLAQSKPRGVAIERRALGMVEVAGKKMKMQDILQMYAETGSFVYVGTDQHGRPYPFKPIEELAGGISEAAMQHLQFIINQIDLLRMVLGLSEITDGSAPHPKTPKFAAEEAISNTDNALGDLYHAFISIYERTAKKVCLLVPDAELKDQLPGKAAALPGASKYFFDNRFIGLMDFAISVDAGITTELRARLTDHINAALKSNGGVLLPEDAFLIENEKNLFRAYQLLAQKRRQREQEMLEMEMAKMQKQAEGNTETAVALEREKQVTLEVELEAYTQKKDVDTRSAIAIEREKAVLNIMLEKVKAGVTLSLKEQEIYGRLLETEMKVRGDLEKANVLAKAQRQKQKSAA